MIRKRANQGRRSRKEASLGNSLAREMGLQSGADQPVQIRFNALEDHSRSTGQFVGIGPGRIGSLCNREILCRTFRCCLWQNGRRAHLGRFQFQGLPSRPIEHLVPVRNRLPTPLALVAPFDVIDAFRMSLGVAVDADSVPEPAAGFDHDGTELPSPSTLTFLTTLTRALNAEVACDIAVIVRPKEISRKKRRGWTPRWTPNPRFCGHQDGHQTAMSLKIKGVAEREGFEPPIPVKVCLLSRQVPSTTRPSLRTGWFKRLF